MKSGKECGYQDNNDWYQGYQEKALETQFFIIVTLQSSSDNNNTERENKVLEIYNNQGKTTRDIAKEQRLSLRDISHILKSME